MKKILITLLALTLALVMLFALTACGGDDADSDANTADGGDNSGGAAVHQHSVASMKMENTVPATCSQNGSYDEVSYCSCGDVISRNTVTVDKVPHSTVSHEAKSATCTEIGWDAYETCSRCDYTTYAEKPALEHSVASMKMENAVPATCSQNGSYDEVSYCSCGDVISRNTVTVDKIPHSTVSHEAKSATCTEVGWDAYVTCSRCEYSTYAEKPALEHDEINHQAQNPTCTEIGWDAYVTCSRCEYSTYAEKPALEHSVASMKMENAVPATCSQNGSYDEVSYCSCGDVISRNTVTLDKIPHSTVSHEAKSATCTEVGWDAYVTCSRCDYTTCVEKPALEHDEINHQAQNPTCTEIGWDAYVTCSRCDYTTYAEKSLLPHTYLEKNIFECRDCDHINPGSKGLSYYKIFDGDTIIGYSVGRGNCTDTDVVIPKEYNGKPVIEIHSNAFNYFSSLKKVFIPDSVTSIGESAFYSCEGLTGVYITDIGAWCGISFRNPSSNPLCYADNLYLNGELVTELVIPDGITLIDNYAFYGCEGLTSVTIGDSVTSIGSYAFRNCTNLKSVTIPDSVTSIGNYAFYDCTALEEIYFNATAMNDLGSANHVFYNAGMNGDGIKVVIGKDVTKIPACLFYSYYSPKITSVEFEAGSVCESIGSYAFAYCSSLESVTIGDSVTSIGDTAFTNCTSLTSVVIPNSVTSIGYYAFEDCRSLTSIVIPDSVTSIGYSAFEDCTSLTSVYITDIAAWCGISFGNSYSNPLYCAKNLYLNDELVTELVIPDGVTSIGERAFFGCTSLTSFEIPDSVTSIGERAFVDCTSLTKVVIGDGVISIGEGAFVDCTALEEIYFNAVAMSALSYDNYVFAYAGQNGSGIKVVIGKDVTKIPAYLFYPYSSDSSYSPKITSVEFEAGSVCESIGSYAFFNCTSLTSIVIPDSVTSIGSSAFGGCSSLESITVPFVGGSKNASNANAETLFGYIFGTSSYSGSYEVRQYYASSNYTTYYIPSSLKSVTITGGKIYYGAFYNCEGLTSVVIGDSVTSIGDLAFYDCTSLTSVTIGDSVETLGAYAFYGCSQLSEITFGESLTSIGDCAFYNCASLKSVIIPDSVETLGAYAFYGCSQLSEITLGESLTSIGDGAFYNCTALEEIYFNAVAMNDLSAENYVFFNAGKKGDGIKVIIGKDVTKIPAYFFYPNASSSYSPKITSIEFEEGSACESIGDFAFRNCTSLTIIYYRGTETEWDAISKYSGWNYNTGNYTIIYNYTEE